jgi:hypothetical protein
MLGRIGLAALQVFAFGAAIVPRFVWHSGIIFWGVASLLNLSLRSGFSAFALVILGIRSLPPLPENWTRIPDFTASPVAWPAGYGELSLFEAVGLALGASDLNRDMDVFDQQMLYFFGSESLNISYSVE